MANVQNLKPKTTLTEEEAKRLGHNGGVKSGVARRRNKGMKQIAQILLSLPLNNGESTGVEEIQSLGEIKGRNITVEEAIILQQIQKALKGDMRSAEFVRETSGQQVVQKIETSETPKIVDDI